MYKKIDVVENVSGNFLLFENLIFAVENTLKVFNEKKSASVDGKICKLLKLKNKIFVEYFEDESGFESTSIFNEDLSQDSNNLLDKKMLRGVLKEKAIVLSYDNEYNTITSIIDLECFEEEWTSNIKIDWHSLISSELLATWNNKEIDLIHYPSNKSVVNIKLNKIQLNNFISSFGNPIVQKILGLYKNIFLIQLQRGIILPIDIENGEILESYDLIKLSAKKDLVTNSIFLDNNDGKLKCLGGRYYYEFNLNNQKVEIKKDFGEYGQGNWWISHSTPFDNKFTFTGSKDGINSFPNSYGVFNTNSLSVEWSDGINPIGRESKGFYQTPPKMNNNMLVIKDSNKTLHIYDKKNALQQHL
ncbi:MAG: hypothetical protein ABJJ05_14655 [Maribacter litoralis]|uniref:hypothetical protein n=1 Tax=Maribacter litoralis TaxID=2059726 RepID=UPI003299D077